MLSELRLGHGLRERIAGTRSVRVGLRGLEMAPGGKLEEVK